MTIYNRPVILVVEDNPENLRTIVNTLTEDNDSYNVLTACNGKQSCEIAVKEIPDLIVMDWDMPEMNGIQAIAQIKINDTLKHTPVIVATGVMITPENLEEALGSGASDFIRKPFNKTELLARVNAQLKYGSTLKQIIEQNDVINQRERQLSLAVSRLKSNISSNEKTWLSNALKIENFYSSHKNLLSIINRLKQEIIPNNPKGKVWLEQIENSVKKLADENTWDNYEMMFISLRPGFFEGLRNEFPHLTPNDLRLCSLFSLNLESKDIARILNITPESLKVIRKRLRKKLGLVAEDNLYNFLVRYN